MITFTGNMHFGLVDIGHRGLKGSTAVGKGNKPFSTVIQTTHGAIFHGLYIIMFFTLYKVLSGFVR
jgi:hypothetical protein